MLWMQIAFLETGPAAVCRVLVSSSAFARRRAATAWHLAAVLRGCGVMAAAGSGRESPLGSLLVETSAFPALRPGF